jgi:hypothetical protein
LLITGAWAVGRCQEFSVNCAGHIDLPRILHALRTRFSKFGKLDSRLLRKFLLVRAVVFLFSAAVPSPGLARVQPQPVAVLRFAQKTQRDGAALPGGGHHALFSVGALARSLQNRDGRLKTIRL